MSTVKNDLNKASYSVLRKMDDVYRQTIFKTHIYLQNGAKTLNQAVDMATKDFLDKGINSIEYKNGARVNIASYAEMCLRTANHRAMLLGEGKKRDEYGIHLVVVSAHANTCPKCEPWQGKILIDDVFSHPSKEYIEEYSKKYKLLSEAIKAGFMHPNCRHTITTFIEGITQIPEIPDTDKAMETYMAEQKQRAHERVIRKQKRISEGSCDETNKEEADRKVRLHQKLIRDILKEHPELRRNVGREKNILPVEKIKKMSGNISNKGKVNHGKLISKKIHDEFVNRLNELGIKTYGFEEYRGEPSILFEIVKDLEIILKEFPTIKNLKNGLILRYEDLNNIDDFAETRGKSIVLNKRVYDDSTYLKEMYKELEQSNWFVSGSDYRSVIFHEIGHVLNNKNRSLSRRVYNRIENKSVNSGVKFKEYIKNNISEYASISYDLINYEEILSELISMCYNGNNKQYAREIIDSLNAR